MRIKHLILVIIFGLVCIKSAAYGQDADVEKILAFVSRVNVNADGCVVVTEQIKVNAQGIKIRHGIYRDFPLRYRDRLGNNYKVGFTLLKVTRDGYAEDHHTQKLPNGIRIYIGSKKHFVPPGVHEYSLIYRTTRQLGFFKDRDELYWNVTGNGWDFAIDSAEAVINLPAEAQDKVIAHQAYTGYFGSQGNDFESFTDDDGSLHFRMARALKPYEGLTVAASWPKGFVQEPSFQDKISYFLNDNSGLIAGVITLILLFLYYLYVWVQFGKDPPKGTIIPLFSPPEDISPAAMRYIMKMGYDNKVFSAAIVNMAVKGAIRIEEDAQGYTLHDKSIDPKLLTREEDYIQRELFSAGEYFILKNEHYEQIQEAIRKVKASLKRSFEKVYFFTNAQYFIAGLVFSLVAFLVSLFFVAQVDSQTQYFLAVWLSIWSVGVWFLLRNVKIAWCAFLFQPKKRFSAFWEALSTTVFASFFVAAEVFVIGVLVHEVPVLFVLIFITTIGVNILFYYLLRAPTFVGRKAMDKIEGFKMYLRAAEKDRLNILYHPGKTPELFEKYLPYALALDVEQQWADQFSEVLAQAAADGKEYVPVWYAGSNWHNWDVGNVASGLSSSLSSAISSSSVAPGSSGGSGGGGGGGGGGGW